MLSKSEIDNNSGFFRESYIKFRKSLDETDLNNFTKLTTDEDRFTFILNKQSFVADVLNNDGNKSAAKGLEFKEQGNKAFQACSYNQALYCYTKSLQFFPASEEYKKDLSVTRANRSAALYHMEKYQEALKDIDIAVKSGYPQDLLYKVKDRKARCLLALKQHQAACRAFQETLTALDDSKLKTEKKQKWQRDVQIMISMMTKISAKDEKVLKTQEGEKLFFKENHIYKAACDGVTINRNEVEGRYATASRNIEIGEIILVEQPHCAVLLPEYANTNCFNCFRRVHVGEPCPGCSDVIFCSQRCLKEACKTHHNVECKITKILWSSGLSITCLMALRVVTQNQPDYFTNHTFQEETENLWKHGYRSTDYNTFYNLVSHEANRQAEDMIHRACVAVFLFLCIKAGNYFTEKDEKAEKLIGGLLLRHLQILQFNAHEVSELRVHGKSYTTCTSTFIGGAVYPTLALFNHSCNPSITRYFNGTTVITRAIKNIKKGEKISENYGPMFTQKEKEERIATLKTQYWFDCNCEACSENWPTMDNMDITILPFRCQVTDCGNVVKIPLTTTNCMIICSKCGKNNNIMKGLKVLQDTENIFRLGMAYLEEGDAEGALKKLFDLYKLVDGVLVPPFKDYHLCQQAIRTCFLTRGNMYKIMNNK